MRKKKDKVSLTARQRREQRKVNQPTTQADNNEQNLDQDTVEKKKHNPIAIRITAIVVACLLGVGAIASAVVLIILNQSYDNDKTNPIAVITLSNGQEIEIQLLYKESTNESRDGRAPIANFIYLAESKFYDGTIFSNSALEFLVMEGYTEPAEHRAKDQEFISSLGGFSTRPNKWGQDKFKLGYRLTRQTVISEPTHKEGYVAMLSGTGQRGTSTGFILIHNDSPQLLMNNQSLSSGLTYIGKMTPESIEVLKSIGQMPRTDNTTIEDWNNLKGWQHPTDYDSVRIKTVRIKQLNRRLRKNILNNFEEFVLSNDSDIKGAISGGRTTWDRRANGYLT